ncbi:MAG: hypothetical protein JXA95_18110 [Spirochaetales bacterium]|nr:hypothetical protein [Spirochaetales bacterium]
MKKEVPAYRIRAVLDAQKGFSLSAEVVSGGFLPGRDACHWPSLTPVRLKKAETLSGSSYQLLVKGLKRSQVREGDLLFPADWDSGRCRKALFYCPRGGEYGRDRSFAVTTLTGDPLGERNIKVQFSYSGCLARAEFDEPVLGIKGGEYRFLRMEEPLILIGRGEMRRSDSEFVGKAMSSWKDHRDNLFREFLALELGWHGFALVPREYEDLSLPRCERGDGVLIRSQNYKTGSARIRKRASAMGGVSLSSFSDALDRHTAELMVARGELVTRGDWLLLPRAVGEDGLSPMARRQLTLLKEKGGVANPAESRDRGSRENWEAMGRMGLIRYDEGLVMTGERYEKESGMLVERLKKKGPADLAALREVSSLSRRELLILLAWMEKDGLILNRGDIREAIG